MINIQAPVKKEIKKLLAVEPDPPELRRRLSKSLPSSLMTSQHEDDPTTRANSVHEDPSSKPTSPFPTSTSPLIKSTSPDQSPRPNGNAVMPKKQINSSSSIDFEVRLEN